MSYQTFMIGIDLGTTNSSVAINNSGVIEIVKKTRWPGVYALRFWV